MKNINDFWVEWCARIFVAALAICLVWIMCSCRTQYIPVETVHHDSLYFSKYVHDSIYVQDSVYIKEKGDTVFVDKYHTVFRHVSLNDTVYIERNDTIRIPYPIERKLSWWEQITYKFNTGYFYVVSLFIIYLLIRWLVRKSRKE